MSGSAPEAGGALTDRILDAAREQFTTFGLRRSTVDDVAERAGVSRVTVYRRVGNKDELAQRVLLREYRRFVAEVDAAVAGLPTMEERMVEGFAALLRLVRGHPPIGGLMRLEPETMLPYLTLESGPSFLAMRGYLAGHLRRARRTASEAERAEAGGAGTDVTDAELDAHPVVGAGVTDHSIFRTRGVVRCLMAPVPPPLRIAPALFLAYWNTHRPGTDPRTRRPLGAAV
ncbi:TetR/AcrR family transcriptional regulator [Streptomyces sp. NPDC020883]|uniref:TetR/AcrR family transcriptional regulator n=1 Tax=Streptomyces sp. NPDC020883 TaxID=3365099 RepID=UPI0037953D75